MTSRGEAIEPRHYIVETSSDADSLQYTLNYAMSIEGLEPRVENIIVTRITDYRMQYTLIWSKLKQRRSRPQSTDPSA